jgi:hypothetical protein
VCMHIEEEASMDLEHALAAVEEMGPEELGRLQSAIAARLASLRLDEGLARVSPGPASTVLERREHRSGVLQLETRAYRRNDGQTTARGPYWYFHYRDGGRQRTIYLGKTDEPEARLSEKLP